MGASRTLTPGWACRTLPHHRWNLLEADAHQPVHLAGRTRLRESGAALVPVRGHRMASRRIPALGSALLGRPIADRPGSARRSLSVQLDPIPFAAPRWLTPTFVPNFLLTPHPT